jgi:putative spermidine/putrescine transport system ATP-binding protein
MTQRQNFKALRLEGLGHDFGPTNAFSNVSLDLKRGEFLALLGPSGSGKSTLLNCISGLITPSTGKLWLDTTRLDLMPVEQRGFGMIFQNYALFPHMSVRRNIGYGLKMRKLSRQECEHRVENALRMVRLEGHADKMPHQLSGGQQQRVGIARAIVIEPSLVLMDEPLSNLDAQLRLEMRQEIREIHDRLGCSTIYVTHDLDEAISLADRVAILRHGSIQQIGTPAELYEKPATVDLAEFMGFRNRLSGRLHINPLPSAGDRARFTLEDVTFEGVVMNDGEDDAILALIRPDDLKPAASDGGIEIIIESMEYRGDHFSGKGQTARGMSLYFTSPTHYANGASVCLSADPAKILLYKAPTPLGPL